MPHRLKRIIPGMLIGVAACATPGRTELVDAPTGPLAEAALQRDREVAARERSIRIELDSVRRATPITIRERNLPSLFWNLPYLVPEREMLETVAGLVQQEREALRNMMHAVPADLGSQLVFENSVLTQAGVFRLHLRMYEHYETLVRRATLQIAAAQHANVPADSMSQLRRELVLLQRVLAARQQARETWNYVLTSLDMESLEELDRREQQRHGAAVAARRARDAQAVQTVTELVVTFGVVAAMAAVFNSGLQDEGKAAEEWLIIQKENKKSECEREGRAFSDGGSQAVGICVP
jgi:hypothetical protein